MCPMPQSNMQFYQVPLPLLTKSPPELRLLLWIFYIGGVKDERATMKSSHYSTFARKLGYETMQRANEAISRALYYLNDNYFPRLDKKALRAFGSKLPDAIEIVDDDDRIKVVGLTAGTYPYDCAMERGRGSASLLRQKVEDLRRNVENSRGSAT